MQQPLRPTLVKGIRLRERSDGSFGAYHPATGRALELAADQASLVKLLDGARTVPDLAAEHLRLHGSVPFGALRDLLRSLAQSGLLANSPAELATAGLLGVPRRMRGLWDRLLFSVPLPAGGLIALIFSAAFAGAALLAVGVPALEVSTLEVPLAYAGASLALSARGFFKAATASVLGVPPVRLRMGLTMGVLHLAPDHASAVLLDRSARACAYGAALAGGLAG